MKLVENLQVTQTNQSQLIKVKSIQSFRVVFRTKLKLLPFLCLIAKKAPIRMLDWVLITQPLKLTIKTSEQYHLFYSCAFIVDFE